MAGGRRDARSTPVRQHDLTALPAPTLRDDASHAASFANHEHPEWYTEWWYFNVRDPKTGISFLAVYDAAPIGLGVGVFATMVFAKDGTPFGETNTFAPSQVSVSGDRADVRLGPNTVKAVDDDTYQIVAASADGRVAWDLTLKRVPGAGPAWLLHDAPGPLSWEVGYWMSWLPHATASGTVTLDGVDYQIDNAAAYHDHNWGVWCSPLRNWQWLQCSSPTERVALDLGYSDGFDPPRAALLDLDGRAIRFEPGGIEVPTYSEWHQWQDDSGHETPWQYPCAATAALTSVDGNVRVQVQWSATPERTLPMFEAIVLFEQHVQVTLRVSEKAGDGSWGPARTFEMDGISEWSDSYVASWSTGEGLIGAYRGEATVFGAGVTGLTAAQELIERGFAVTLVETERALDPAGKRDMAVGGMARSQYARVPRIGKAPPTHPAGRPTANTDHDDWRAAHARFAPDTVDLVGDAARALHEAARAYRDQFCDQGYRLRVTGSAAASEREPRVLALRRAREVRDRLLETGIGPDLILLDEDPSAAQPQAVVTLEDYVLPGEHGYRFFPSYYRHLADTMSRTPTYDRDGRQTGGRVLDNLKPTPVSVNVRSGSAPSMPPLGQISALQALRMVMSMLNDEDYDPRDFLQMGLRITRYLATCPDRRKALEAISWWAYLSGLCPKTGCYLYRYSDQFSRDATASGRVLAAFDWRYGDARTNGSTWVQLTEPLPDAAGKRYDGTLDGPTTEAWFVHWRRYLEERGVVFVSGALERIELHEVDGREVPIPWVKRTGKTHSEPWRPRTRKPHYLVCATDAPTAERVSKHLPDVGVPHGLRGYTTVYDHKKRNPLREPGLGPSDRFQTLSGVQYFFDQTFAISDHSYSMDAPWALSTLSSQRVFSRVPVPHKDGYAGLLSVDVGSYRVKAGPTQTTAWDSTKEGLAEQIWMQLSNDLRTDAGMPLRLPRPNWFHVDDNISFGDRDGKKDVIVRNSTPYLVPITADWDNRPGPAPFDPNVPDATRPPDNAQPGVWYAPHGGYPVHWDSLVYGGIYLKTFTRMTTMESANESGRHAVNAVLDHYNAHHGTSVAPALPPAKRPPGPLSIEADEVPQAYLGDYCGIWNIERFEPSNFDGLKAIDQVLVDLGLPHLFDLLGIELVPSILSHLIPYRGDCSPTSQPAPKPVPLPAKWCPPFIGQHLGSAIRKWRQRKKR